MAALVPLRLSTAALLISCPDTRVSPLPFSQLDNSTCFATNQACLRDR
jgi:hypothetical protein